MGPYSVNRIGFYFPTISSRTTAQVELVASVKQPLGLVHTVRFFLLRLRFFFSQQMGCTELNGSVHTSATVAT